MRRIALLASLTLIVACSDTSEPLVGPDRPDPISPAMARVTGPQQIPAFQPGVAVVRFEALAPAADIAASQGASVARTLKQGIHVLNVPEGSEQAVVSALSRNPRVLFAELSVPRTMGLPCEAPDGDCTVPSDDHFGRRWDLHNDGNIRDAAGNILENQGLLPDADMDWLEAHEQLGAFTEGALVGIVDTGIFPNHEDLAGRLLVQHDFFNIDPIAEDDHGHGTHASGIMLAHGNNGKGVSGIAYGPNIRLAVAKGCGNTIIGYLCWSPDIADGIMWLADQGVAAINLSVGGETPSSAEQVALQYAQGKNVLPICAAGNDEGAVDWPAAFPECMAVSSTGWNDALASYSSFGPEVEVAAPGGEILHLDALDMILSTWLDGGYAYMAGTSMATPQVTGLAGLLHALGVTDADEKRAIIRSTADDLGASGFDTYFGDGRINVWAAVQQAVGDPSPTPDPPVASFTPSCTYLSCDFVDESTDDGGVVSWDWDFGDGNTSPARSPSHVYLAAGTYTVTLTVMDALDQSDEASHDVTVTDPPPDDPPIASFEYSCTGLTCDFTDTSTDDNGVVAWLWYFGDPERPLEEVISDVQHPSYTFAGPGTYTVELLVEDALGGEDRIGDASQVVTVTDPPPPPADPTTLVATAGSSTQINLTWVDASSDETGFSVERSDDGSTGWAEVGTEGIDATSSSDSGLSASTTYYYRVRATGAGDPSGYSNIANATTDPPPEPSLVAHVADIVVAKSKSGRTTVGSADVTIRDQFGAPIYGVTVTGDWLVSAVVKVSGTSGVTGPDGVANDFTSGPLPVKGNDVLRFCVTNVTGLDLSYYDAAANLETCDVPGGSEEPPPTAGFTLTTKVKKNGDVTLRWGGSTATLFDVLRNGVPIAQDDASPYTDRKPGSGTFVYQVCEAEAGTGTCSTESTVTLQ